MAALIACVSLVIGTGGYCYFGNLAPVDGFLNAAMILTGMGPVDRMETSAAKIFSGLYALYAGMAFLTIMAVVMAPLAHRMLHRFHAATEEDEEQSEKSHDAKKSPSKKK